MSKPSPGPWRWEANMLEPDLLAILKELASGHDRYWPFGVSARVYALIQRIEGED